jgi:hypothetical protein
MAEKRARKAEKDVEEQKANEILRRKAAKVGPASQYPLSLSLFSSLLFLF